MYIASTVQQKLSSLKSISIVKVTDMKVISLCALLLVACCSLAASSRSRLEVRLLSEKSGRYIGVTRHGRMVHARARSSGKHYEFVYTYKRHLYNCEMVQYVFVCQYKVSAVCWSIFLFLSPLLSLQHWRQDSMQPFLYLVTSGWSQLDTLASSSCSRKEH